jgi:DNA adenine methylase
MDHSECARSPAHVGPPSTSPALGNHEAQLSTSSSRGAEAERDRYRAPVSTRVSLVTHHQGVAPFLKWPGGKRWLIRLGINLPVVDDGATYFEPFLGAGSLYFALAPEKAELSDLNGSLIDAYRGLRVHLSAVVRELRQLSNDQRTFERVRAAKPSSLLEKTVRFIYLNRTAFGGLYRENKDGNFNVPFGHYVDRNICQESVLRDAARALRGARLQACSFLTSTRRAKAGDFVYLDPPYITNHQQNGFIRYNRRLFTWEQQVILATEAKRLADQGVHVLISNSAHEEVLALYDSFEVDVIGRKNQISRNPEYRGTYSEALIASFRGVLSRDEPRGGTRQPITVRSVKL